MGKERDNINVVIIGHVDSGKSTTCGCLLAQLGNVDKRTMERYEKEAQEMGKGSFKFAWAMDQLKAERERGITIDNSLNKFTTSSKQVTIIDAPGHRDFIKNMISGASQADSAILMISAAKGEYEAGISKEGQTREHILLAHTLGIKSLIVCINKMDTEDADGKVYSEKRYNEVKNDLNDYLMGLKFKKENINFVPISGFNGENIVKKSDKMSWYKEKPLESHIDNLPVPKRMTKKPLRIPIQSKYKIAGIGTVASGRVETGTMKTSMNVVFMPNNISSEVKSIEMHHAPVPEAQPGDNIGFNVKNVPYKDIKKGMVVGSQKDTPPKVAKEFKANVIILNHRGEIRPGYSPVVHVHSAHVSCKLTKIENIFDKRTGKPITTSQDYLKKDQGALCTFEPEKPMVVERYKKFSPLGRFSIRDSKVTVGVGVINDVVFKEE